ncbi:hypothetical protein, partial [Streptomyces seoulensis]|uniref:hypothetical protein n=1 Tax=Streptomyces seoulensis TaxID=73044 RepID=UPI00339ED31C
MPEPVLLPGGGWRLWRHLALRGPGFPVSGVLRLAPQGLAEAADRFGAGAELAGADWACRITGYSREIPLAPRIVRAVRQISMASRTL